MPRSAGSPEVEAGKILRLVGRKAEFEADWNRNLLGILPPDVEVEFENTWKDVVDYVAWMAETLDHGT